MIEKIIELWEKNKNEYKSFIENLKPSHDINYEFLIENLIKIVLEDFKIINIFRTESYQGDVIIIFGENCYGDFFYDKLYASSISYGSCSGCDAIEQILQYSDNIKFTEQEVNDLMTIALHIIQKSKKIFERESD